LGVYHSSTPEIPLGGALTGILTIKIFLDNIVAVAVFLLVILGNFFLGVRW